MTKLLTYVELDISYCSLVYGNAPCTAAIGVTGSDKCYNGLATCQDTANFSSSTVTLRFAQDVDYLPDDIEAIPSLRSVDYSPGTISLGEDLGERATVTFRFKDHPYGDTGNGHDKYYAERSYDPFTQGTFWGKFRARQPFLRGQEIRLIRGTLGQALSAMDTRYYVVDSFNMSPDGIYTLVAKDILKLADTERALAPVASNGYLLSALSSGVTSATLGPTGIGDAEYPASGYITIGGEEICSFTRSGDALTLTRGQFNTTDTDHDSEDRVQLCLYYQSEDPADIIYDLLTTYGNIDTSFINLTTWQTETSTFYGRLLTAMIGEPIPVKELVSQVIQDAALAMWWNDESQKIRLQVLRAISSDAITYDQSNTLVGTLRTQEQPNKRISQVWTYYGRRNPLLPMDETDNYKSIVVSLDSNNNYGSDAIKVVKSRWIPTFGQSTASRLNDLLLARYKNPPRSFKFEVFRHGNDDLSVTLGSSYNLSGWSTQDASGNIVTTPVQITRLNPAADKWVVEGEENLVSEIDVAQDLTNRTIIIDSDTNNVNMRTIHDNIYPDPTDNESPSVFVTCIISEGVVVGSTSPSLTAFDVGTWPTGVTLSLQVLGRIQGAGGNGADGDLGTDATSGGLALYTREFIDIDLDGSNGEIWGGGGGGGGAFPIFVIVGGGGGAGTISGIGGGSSTGGTADGEDGTPTTGGAGGSGGGGAGGDPGQDGNSGSSGSGSFKNGATAGDAIDGLSYITFTNGAGDRRGDEIN